MKRYAQLLTLFILLFTLLLRIQPVTAHPRLSPCSESADQSIEADCALLQAYWLEQTKNWRYAAIPESTMGATELHSALGADLNTEEMTRDQQFRETVMAAEHAFQSGEVDKIIEYYAEDAISMPPGFPASVGKEAIDADLRYFFGEYDLDRDFTLVNFGVTGDTATRTGEWTQTLTPRAGGDPIVEIGRCIFGFKQIDDEWKIAWEIWNTYEPMN